MSLRLWTWVDEVVVRAECYGEENVCKINIYGHDGFSFHPLPNVSRVTRHRSVEVRLAVMWSWTGKKQRGPSISVAI